jgi:class 3 adenylate cyclase
MTAPRERRAVTVVFSDLSGFTRPSERMDPEDVAETVDALFRRFRASIESLGGTVDKFIGDAVMAVLGALAGEKARAQELAAEGSRRTREAEAAMLAAHFEQLEREPG